jgi:hypothetical protein
VIYTDLQIVDWFTQVLLVLVIFAVLCYNRFLSERDKNIWLMLHL